MKAAAATYRVIDKYAVNEYFFYQVIRHCIVKISVAGIGRYKRWDNLICNLLLLQPLKVYMQIHGRRIIIDQEKKTNRFVQ